MRCNGFLRRALYKTVFVRRSKTLYFFLQPKAVSLSKIGCRNLVSTTAVLAHTHTHTYIMRVLVASERTQCKRNETPNLQMRSFVALTLCA